MTMQTNNIYIHLCLDYILFPIICFHKGNDIESSVSAMIEPYNERLSFVFLCIYFTCTNQKHVSFFVFWPVYSLIHLLTSDLLLYILSS